MNEFSFSILMANYNNESYIRTAIESVISQTYNNWELIIVDDSSSDKSRDIINQYLKNNNVKLIQHEKRLGYGGALKTAALESSNDIIGILDADDKIHHNALELMKNAYDNNPDCGFIYSNFWICNSNLKECELCKTVGPIIPKKSFIYKPNKISHFKTFKKNAYLKTKGFEVSQKRAVDKDIIYKLEEVTQFKFINVPLYYYRSHKKGISQYNNENAALKYHLIAKYKTYKRRLGLNLPNFTRKELFIYFIYSRKLIYYIFGFISENFSKFSSLFLSFLKIIFKYSNL